MLIKTMALRELYQENMVELMDGAGKHYVDFTCPVCKKLNRRTFRLNGDSVEKECNYCDEFTLVVTELQQFWEDGYFPIVNNRET